MSTCTNELKGYDIVKKCPVCKNVLLKSNFDKNKTKRDSYRSECRSCFKEYYHNNRDRLLNNMKN